MWRQLPGYHRRNRVVTKMNFIRLLEQRLGVLDFDQKVAEVQISATILNTFTALGIPNTITVR